jgi:hypothetical protein
VDKKNQITRIRSLFQPEAPLAPLFNFLVDWISNTNDEATSPSTQVHCIRKLLKSGPLIRTACLMWAHFLPGWHRLTSVLPKALCSSPRLCIFVWIGIGAVSAVVQLLMYFLDWCWGTQLTDCLKQIGIASLVFGLVTAYVVIVPLVRIYCQLQRLANTMGYGLCSGFSNNPQRPALVDWLYKGVQDAAGVEYARPLTFKDLWQAPCGPAPAYPGQAVKSLDLIVISACISHGRIYEIPNKNPKARLFFKLSEFKKYFPAEVIDYLKLVARPVDLATDADLLHQFKNRNSDTQICTNFNLLKKQFDTPVPDDASCMDIRELPSADLPIVVAARLSFAVPILFQALPLLGLDLDQEPKEMRLVRLWFSDGGVSNNMPVQLFDKALPRWPTFAARIVNAPPRIQSPPNKQFGQGSSFVPYTHERNAHDSLLDPMDKTAYTVLSPGGQQGFAAFMQFCLGIYETAKNGNDRATFRAPEVRGRIVKIYTQNKTQGALNLKLSQQSILDLGQKTGVKAGQKLADVYLAQKTAPDITRIHGWHDQRWIRLHSLINGMRQYLQGFGYAVVHPFDGYGLLQQIQDATLQPPLAGVAGVDDKAQILTQPQAQALTQAVMAIAALEQTLSNLARPQPYAPAPASSLRFKVHV